MLTLMIFIGLIYISGIFDYGKMIDDYIKIDEDGLYVAEKLGVGLIEYDSRIDKILDGMLETGFKSIDDAMSFNLKLNDNLQIDDIKPYLTDIQTSIDPTDREIFGNFNFARRDYTGYYDTREKVKQINRDWRQPKDLQQSFIEEEDINVMLEKFMPKILSMANSGIPDNIEFSGNSFVVSRSPVGPQNFHQDIDQQAFLSSATADHEYRIIVFDRDEKYDTSWTDISTEIDGREAEKYVKTNFARYDFAKLIDFNIDKSKYIALVFDNNKVFHRTPPTTFWNWVSGNIPEQRRVTQFRISWDDYDQLNYEDEYDEERFQEIMNGGGYTMGGGPSWTRITKQRAEESKKQRKAAEERRQQELEEEEQRRHQEAQEKQAEAEASEERAALRRQQEAQAKQAKAEAEAAASVALEEAKKQEIQRKIKEKKKTHEEEFAKYLEERRKRNEQVTDRDRQEFRAIDNSQMIPTEEDVWWKDKEEYKRICLELFQSSRIPVDLSDKFTQREEREARIKAEIDEEDRKIREYTEKCPYGDGEDFPQKRISRNTGSRW
jgi:hypothetical protein